LLRPSGARAVGSFLPQLTRKAFARYGFSTAALLTDWAAIVGPELARSTAPERLKWPRRPQPVEEDGERSARARQGATLIVRVEGARALEVQFAAPQILERINAYFGHAAVAHLRLLQAPVEPDGHAHPARKARAAAKDLAGAAASRDGALSARCRELEAIPAGALRSALQRLGEAISAARSDHADLP
jgi:hypothetical protein